MAAEQNYQLNPNQATDSKLCEKVVKDLVPTLRRIRDERRVLDQAFLRYYRIWSAERDQQAYAGRSRTYLTVGRRIIENWVQKMKRDLLANDDWFDVVALREAFEQRVPPIKALFDYYFKKQIRLRRRITPFLRQLVTLGTSPVSVVWRCDERVIPVLRDALDSGGNPTGQTVRKLEKVLQYIGPTFRTCDLFAWRVSPVTIMDVCDASQVAEEMLIDRQRLRQLGKTPLNPDDEDMGNVFENVDKVFALYDGEGSEVGVAQGENSDKFTKERERLQAKGFSGRVPPAGVPKPVDVTSVYWRTDLDGSGIDWWRITISCDQIVNMIQKNPFWHGLPPWLAGKFTEVENEFYGRSICENFDRLQYFLNDVADQANDALVWSMNPIAVVDGYRVQDPTSLRMVPGAKWLAEPDAVQFMEPPKESAAVGFQATGQMIQFMNDVSNVAPFAGSPATRPGTTDTATGAQLVAQETLVQVIDAIENVEDQVLIPFMRMAHTLTMQCLSRDLILRVTGEDGLTLIEHKISASEVVGDFDFDWLGSTGASNRHIRAQQMISFLQITAQIPPQLLQAQNATIDLPFILRQIWSVGMGLRDSKRVVRDITEMKSVDPKLENDLFLASRGEEVKVSPADNDAMHMKEHSKVLGNPDLPEDQISYVVEHNQEHQASMLTKQVMQQMQQQAQLGQPNAPGGPQPMNPQSGPGNGAAPSTNMPLNPGRTPGTATASDVMRSIPRIPGGLGNAIQ